MSFHSISAIHISSAKKPGHSRADKLATFRKFGDAFEGDFEDVGIGESTGVVENANVCDVDYRHGVACFDRGSD